MRPEACFVVKTHIVPNAAKNDKSVKGDKLFVNIVQSAQIAPPVGTPVNGGMQVKTQIEHTYICSHTCCFIEVSVTASMCLIG